MTTLPTLLPFADRPYAPGETLLYYDGPLLFWLPGGTHALLAVALLESPGRPYPFLVAALSAATREALENRALTLRAAVQAATAWYLMPDYDAETLHFEPLASVPEDWLPGDVLL